MTLTPDKPLLRNGKKIVVAGGEPGSEYGMDFVKTIEGKDGPAVWLAKRGVTFVALTRVGRWNFLAPTRDGSWETVPIGKRMPIFNRAQTAHWTDADYETKQSGLAAGASASTSLVYRYPRKGTALEKQMLAATPRVFIEGYRLALEKAIPDRAHSLVLFWGMSTGGASLYPLAKYYTPDGYLGWGTSSTGLAYVSGKAMTDNFSDVYAPMALRVRERGLDDFEFYTKHVDAATRAKWWQAALKDPRFKSTEDASMQFGAAGLTEHGLRLWNSDFLPAQERERGLAAFMQAMFETSYPPAELKRVPVLELNGTNDEAHTARDRRLEPEGDGALRQEIPRRAHRRPAPLSVHAGQHQGRGQHVDEVHRLRLFRLSTTPWRPLARCPAAAGRCGPAQAEAR